MRPSAVTVVLSFTLAACVTPPAAESPAPRTTASRPASKPAEKAARPVAAAARPATTASSAPAPASARRGGGDTNADYAALEREVLAELNRARRDPRAYAATLDTFAGWYDGKLFKRPGAALVLETNEGVSAAREAVRVVRSLPPVGALTRSSGLTRAARDHVADKGPGGRTGHQGSDGSSVTDRVGRYGQWGKAISENIAYGPLDARGMIAGLVIDDGVPDRGHRVNAFDARVRAVGVACGPHKLYGRMCVLVHAAEYREGSIARTGGR